MSVLTWALQRLFCVQALKTSMSLRRWEMKIRSNRSSVAMSHHSGETSLTDLRCLLLSFLNVIMRSSVGSADTHVTGS